MNEGGQFVSVIIPTYNRAHLIGRAIQSVLNQTYQDFEIIVVDDDSTDNTEEIIKKFQKKDKRIRYIKHEKNKGAGVARNTGIKLAKGKYIGLLDDDDEWLPEKLEKQINKFQTLPDDFGVVYSGFSFISEKSGKAVFSVVPALRGDVYDAMLKECIVGSPTPLIRRNCFQRAGLFDETLPSCQDWDMWIRLSKYYKFDFVPEILAKHHVHGGQISVSLNAKILAREKLIEKYQDDLQKRPQTLSILLNRLGILYSLAGDSSKARKYFLGSIKRRPFWKRNYIHIFLSVISPQIHKNILKKYHICTTEIDGITFY